MSQSIHIHAMVTLPDGSQEFCYPSDANGRTLFWTAYRRIETPNDPRQPFDLKDEGDFQSKDAAIAYANTLARIHSVTDIEHDY